MIKHEDVRQIVQRVFTVACNSGGDPFAEEPFEEAVWEVHRVLKGKALVQGKRYARVKTSVALSRVKAYLPHNFDAFLATDGDGDIFIRIEGFDHAGWTLDGYVIPRLASGLIAAEEIQKGTD